MRRFRRLRQTEEMRSFVRETRIGREDLIYPVFVQEGRDIREPVPSMPGVFRYSIDRLDEILARIKSLGIPAIRMREEAALMTRRESLRGLSVLLRKRCPRFW